jgi:hypothetical protein
MPIVCINISFSPSGTHFLLLSLLNNSEGLNLSLGSPQQKQPDHPDLHP